MAANDVIRHNFVDCWAWTPAGQKTQCTTSAIFYGDWKGSLVLENNLFSGGGFTVMVELLDNYPYTQVFAPQDKDYLALEPMTAPANALVSGEGLRLVEPGATFSAAFRFRIAADA